MEPYLIVYGIIITLAAIYLYRDRKNEWQRAEVAVAAFMSEKAANAELKNDKETLIANESKLRQELERVRTFNGELVDKCNAFERMKSKWKSLQDTIETVADKKPPKKHKPSPNTKKSHHAHPKSKQKHSTKVLKRG